MKINKLFVCVSLAICADLAVGSSTLRDIVVTELENAGLDVEKTFERYPNMGLTKAQKFIDSCARKPEKYELYRKKDAKEIIRDDLEAAGLDSEKVFETYPDMGVEKSQRFISSCMRKPIKYELYRKKTPKEILANEFDIVGLDVEKVFRVYPGMTPAEGRAFIDKFSEDPEQYAFYRKRDTDTRQELVYELENLGFDSNKVAMAYPDMTAEQGQEFIDYCNNNPTECSSYQREYHQPSY